MRRAYSWCQSQADYGDSHWDASRDVPETTTNTFKPEQSQGAVLVAAEVKIQ